MSCLIPRVFRIFAWILDPPSGVPVLMLPSSIEAARGKGALHSCCWMWEERIEGQPSKLSSAGTRRRAMSAWEMLWKEALRYFELPGASISVMCLRG